MPPLSDAPSAPGRASSIRGFLLILVAYLVVVLVATIVTWQPGEEQDVYTGPGDVWTRLVLRTGIMLVFVAGTVTVLRWWRPVLVDDRPVRRWIWVVPGVLGLTIVGGTNYGGLAGTSLGFVALLLAGTLLVGLTEELVFRGIAVTAFRANGYPEGRVALWTCVLFALSHATRLIAGPAGLIQVVATLAGGYLYYLTRRVSGGLVAPVLLHGLWDFGVFSAAVVDGETYDGVALFFLPIPVLLVVLLARRRRIEPSVPVAG